MSDETPPSLRLKPRLKPEDPGVEANAQVSPPAQTPEEGGSGGFRIRLRPKLAAEPAATDAATPQTEIPPLPRPDDLFPSPEAIAEDHPATEEVPPSPLPETPKFRLKTRTPEPSAPQPEEEEPLPPPLPGEDASIHNPESMMKFDPATGLVIDVPVPVSPLYIPAVETPAVGALQFNLPQRSPALPPIPSPDEDPAPKPRFKRPKIKAGTLGLVAAILFILLCGAFFIKRVVNQPASTGARVRTKIKTIPVEVAPPAPTPTPEPTPTPVPMVVENPRPKATNNVVTTSIAPGISATSSDSVVAVNASPAFRSWVAGARISGVFQGATPRALINGRMIRAGQVADEGLSIVFDSIDVENKMIIFKDRAGAEVTRRY